MHILYVHWYWIFRKIVFHCIKLTAAIGLHMSDSDNSEYLNTLCQILHVLRIIISNKTTAFYQKFNYILKYVYVVGYLSL